MGKGKYPVRRVDIQVSILAAMVVLLSTSCIFALGYHITYQDMLVSLTKQVNSIHSYVENKLDESAFTEISDQTDMNTEAYIKASNILNEIRQITGVQYLYTAGRNEAGEMIYLVDGLDRTNGDFRYPGDRIEDEIQEDLELALSGKTVLPDKIKMTNWGKIFITYFPVHENGEVSGVLGIEINAESEYDTYRILRLLFPVVLIFCCTISVCIAFICFRRISNPGRVDLYNMDQMTGIKNQNAFRIDMNNLKARQSCNGMGIVVTDLNNLKKVNDFFGHTAGDKYIICAAEVIQQCVGENALPYRTGGDEFAIIFYKTNLDQLEAFKKQLCETFKSISFEWDFEPSMSCGVAMYERELDLDFMATYTRADNNMYQDKKEFHETEKGFDMESGK